MNANDKSLIEMAMKVPYTQWYDITAFLDKSESDEAREELLRIRSSKYHTEESMMW